MSNEIIPYQPPAGAQEVVTDPAVRVRVSRMVAHVGTQPGVETVVPGGRSFVQKLLYQAENPAKLSMGKVSAVALGGVIAATALYHALGKKDAPDASQGRGV